MVDKLRQQADGSSLNHDTSHDGDEILALFGAIHLARRPKSLHEMWKNERADNPLAFAEGCKRQFALILQSRGRGKRLGLAHLYEVPWRTTSDSFAHGKTSGGARYFEHEARRAW